MTKRLIVEKILCFLQNKIQIFASIYLKGVFPMEDTAIISLFFEREELAIHEARTKYGRYLLKTAMNILQNNEDAEECVNDTLLKAWEHIPPQKPSNLDAFLAKITRNLSLDKWRAKNASKRGQGEMPLLLNELNDCLTQSTESDFEHNQTETAINNFLRLLPNPSRTAFIQRYFYGEPISDISRNLGMREGAVRSLLFRTRKNLKIHLENEGVSV
jgi:RNA polymerase sigma-70 factor (ECF subfamily)